MIIAARTLDGTVIGYHVPPTHRREVWAWLNSLSCILNVWEETQTVFTNRRIRNIQKEL